MNIHKIRTTSMGLDAAQVIQSKMPPSVSVSYAVTRVTPFPLNTYIGIVTRRS